MPPDRQFEEQEGFQSTSLNSLFTQLTRVTTLGCLVYSAIMLMVDGDPMRVLATMIIAVAGPVSSYLRRNQGPRLGFSVYLWAIALAIVAQSAVRGGLSNPVLHAYVVLILMGGWLLGARQALAFLAVAVGWIGVLTLAGTYQWWTPLPSGVGFGYWISMTGVWVIGYLAMRLVLDAYRQRVTDVLALDTELRVKIGELTVQEKATRANEQRVSQMLMVSPLPIAVSTLDTGVYVDLNPAWERTFGYAKQDVIGKTSLDLGFWHDMAARRAWIDLFSADGRVSDHEVTLVMRDGSLRVFMLSSERFSYDNEACLLTVSVDVTQRKQLEAQLMALNLSLEQRVEERTHALDKSNQELLTTMDTLKRAQEELVQSEKLASLGSMVAGIAHELNTPLGNAMVTVSSINDDVRDIQIALQSGALKKSELENFMQRMAQGGTLTQRSVERAVALVSSFKQVAVDQASERRREFDLSQVVNEVMDTLRPTINRSGVVLMVDIDPGLSMDSYPGPLGQVLMNLVTNAVTHAFDGREVGTVHISANVQGGSQLALVVRDDGSGIAQHHLGQIFDPFFTTRLGQGGSGLGLSISHRIVTKVLGGQISVDSHPGRGTSFGLILPIQAPSMVH